MTRVSLTTAEPMVTRMKAADAAARRVVVLAMASESDPGRAATTTPPTTTRQSTPMNAPKPSGPTPAIVQAMSMNSGGPSVTSERTDATAAALATR